MSFVEWYIAAVLAFKRGYFTYDSTEDLIKILGDHGVYRPAVPRRYRIR